MDNHLTERQIAEFLIDRNNGEHLSHLRKCPACAKEVEVLRRSLSQFRGSMREWSADQMAGQRRERAVPRTHPLFKPASVVAFLLLLGIGTSKYLMVKPAPAAPNVVSDATLLDAVSNDVARSIPGDMIPLTASYELPAANAPAR
ncbi:MAG TPA: hypothetical protein VG273_23465 [Bryobacteraceae bacterium]|jgi:hypothetical protein|nr:hypothetical protein [Bryobacteraceae bacterium]